MSETKSCSTCVHYGADDYCEDCEKLDLWFPKDNPATVSVNDGPAITYDKVQDALEKARAKQMDLDGNVVLDTEEETEEEVRTFKVIRHNGVAFRMSEEAYEKMAESKDTDGPGVREDRILRTVQNRAKIVLPKDTPIAHGEWDEAVEAIYRRILEREGLL